MVEVLSFRLVESIACIAPMSLCRLFGFGALIDADVRWDALVVGTAALAFPEREDAVVEEGADQVREVNKPMPNLKRHKIDRACLIFGGLTN